MNDLVDMAAQSALADQEFAPGFVRLAAHITNTHRAAVSGDAQSAEMCVSYLAEAKDKLGPGFPRASLPGNNARMRGRPSGRAGARQRAGT